MEALEKIVIPKILISQEKAIDTIYNIKFESTLNQLMFKLMRSEVLIKECNDRIKTSEKFKEDHGGGIFSIGDLDKGIDFRNKVLERLINYRYNKMMEISNRCNDLTR